MKKLIFIICFCFISIRGFCDDITVGYNTNVEYNIGVFLVGEFIYWEATQEGLAFASSNWDPTGSSTLKKGTIYQPGFRWDPGLKVGLGGFIKDGWDVGLFYTWFQNHSKTTQTSQNSNNPKLYTRWIFDPEDQTQAVHFASGKWELRHHNLDFEFGRRYYLSRFFVQRTFAGLKGVIDFQTNDVRYKDFVGGDEIIYKLNMKQRSWGIGPRLGINNNFYVSKYWSLFGDIALSMLWSRFKVTNKYRYEDPIQKTVIASFTNTINTLKPVIETNLGIMWQILLGNDSVGFTSKLGYEQQLWINQNHFSNLIESGTLGDLTYQGLSARFILDF